MQNRNTAIPWTHSRKLAPVLGMAFVLILGQTAFAQRTFDVAMISEAFNPQELEITAGDTVVWTNTSSGRIPHTATADSLRDRLQGFNSGSFPRRWLYPGETFQFTFTTAGTFPYHCVIHESLGMTGTIIVNAGPSSSSQSFTAAPVADEARILVRWSVPQSKERVGFKVLRSTGWDKQFVQVNEGIVPAEKETGDGQEYRFVDARDVVPGAKYFYILEEVRLDRRESFWGPAIVNPL